MAINMGIYHLAYELYKIDWLRRISADRQMDAMKDYYESLINADEYSFDDYIEAFGYGGELYVCFDEFYENEYLDKAYMKQLFNNDKLFAEYEEHLKQREFYSNWN